VKGVLH